MTHRCRRCTVLALTIAVAGAPLAASAQPASSPPSDTVEQASQHFQRGIRLYQEDDFRAAFIEFSRAYELAPNWAVLYNLGQSQYQLREYAGALKTLEKYVVVGGASIPADRRSEVEREIGELHGRVARVTLSSNTDGAQITLDDALLGTMPAREPFVISAGRHKFGASRPGFVATSRLVDIAGGDAMSVTLDLVPEVTAPPVVYSPPNYTAALVSGGLGVAGIAVGTVFGVLAINDKSSLNKDCNSQKICPSTSQNDINSFSTNGAVSTVGFGVGAAGLLVGGYLFFSERGRERAPAPAAATIAPWVGPGAGGVAGTF